MNAGNWSRVILPISYAQHKGSSGKIAIIGGSQEYAGAPYFSGISALKMGADLVHIICEPSAATAIKSYSPELIVHPLLDSKAENLVKVDSILSRIQSLVVGPGLGRDDATLKVVERILVKAISLSLPIVIDADALQIVQSTPAVIGYKGVILTPNRAEYLRLCSGMDVEVTGDASDTLRRLCKKLGGPTIVRKGRVDVISNGDYVISCAATGSPRRCGGQGDLLSGTLSLFYLWGRLMDGQVKDDGLPIQLLAAYHACLLIKETSAAVYRQKGRSMVTLDMIDQLYPTVKALYPQGLFGGKMCICFLVCNAEYKLVAALNRDEFIDRKTAPASTYSRDSKTIISGIDLEAAINSDKQAHGTWAGLTTEGRFAMLTNYRQDQRFNKPSASSRGDLCAEFLAGSLDGAAYCDQIPINAYNGFNLIVGDAAGAWYTGNRGGSQTLSLSDGVIYGLSNGILADSRPGSTDWPKVTRGKERFRGVLSQGLSTNELAEKLLCLLQDTTECDTPEGMYDERLEQALASICVSRERCSKVCPRAYGTRTHTVIIIDNNDKALFIEQECNSGNDDAVTSSQPADPGQRRRYSFEVLRS